MIFVSVVLEDERGLGHVLSGLRDGLAAVPDLHLGEAVGLPPHDLGGPEQHPLPLPLASPGPWALVEAAPGGVDRGLGILRLGVRRGGDDLLGGGVDHVEPRPVSPVDPLAVDEVLELPHDPSGVDEQA